MRKRQGEKQFGFLSNAIFFLNVVVALLLISGAWLLVETDFGRSVLFFGFFMLSISVVMKVARLW